MAHIRALHADNHPVISSIFAVSPDAVGAWPIYDVPSLPAWTTPRVALIGDAAHAASPSAGQGASPAIEDAAVLAHALVTEATVEAALECFVAARKRRAEKVVALGRQIGNHKVASPAGSMVRDLTLPMFLKMGARATREQYSYRVPPMAAAAS